MPNQIENFRFTVGGPVPPNSRTYIVRRDEKRAIQALQDGTYVSVVGPRQVGKTSFLHRIRSIYEKDYGYSCALLDLSTQNDIALNWEQWSKEFCRKLIQGMHRDLDSGININYPQSPSQLIDYLTSLSRSINAPGILILLDEASAIPNPIRDLFYSNIRFIQNSTLSKVMFVFAGVFDPERLVAQSENSPFNSSFVCRLKDFTPKEVGILANNLHRYFGNPVDGKLSETIYQITGGQPYLTQCLLSLCADEFPGFNINKIQELQADLKDIASVNINHVVRASVRVPQYRDFLQRIFRGEKIKFIRSVYPIGDLELQGALTEDEEGFCKIRNRLYEEALQQSLQQSPAAILTENKFDMALMYQLIDAFLECQAIQDRSMRDIVVRSLPQEIQTTILRNDVDKADVVGIVSRCLEFEGGINHLIKGLNFFEQDSISMKNVKRLLQL